MEQQNLTIGAKVYHPNFGDGVIRAVTLYKVQIFFRQHGDQSLERDDSLEIMEEGKGEGEQLAPGEVESALRRVLEKYTDVTLPIQMGDKWKGGTLVLRPKDPEQKEKEVPIETFFHKIVMVREKLRVLEQNINKTEKLEDEDKVNLQQYITKMYGSLTTFNVLFKEESESFKRK